MSLLTLKDRDKSFLCAPFDLVLFIYLNLSFPPCPTFP
jgi:hypothetical protein